MKKLIIAAMVAALALSACANKPKETLLPKANMELAGNGFDSFSLGADIRVFMTPDQENPKLWNIQAAVPMRKEMEAKLSALQMELSLLDDKGIRVRDSFALQAEDLDNLIPVFNSALSVEKTVVFSVPEVDGGKKRFPYKQAKALIEGTKGAHLNVNAETIVEDVTPQPEDVPYTLPWLCKRTGTYGLLSQYEAAVRKKDNRKANDIESKLWDIEKQVKKNDNYPEILRKRFVEYVEKRIDLIDDKY